MQIIIYKPGTHIPVIVLFTGMQVQIYFWKYWHTPRLNMEKLNLKSLKQVGKPFIRNYFQEGQSSDLKTLLEKKIIL